MKVTVLSNNLIVGTSFSGDGSKILENLWKSVDGHVTTVKRSKQDVLKVKQIVQKIEKAQQGTSQKSDQYTYVEFKFL